MDATLQTPRRLSGNTTPEGTQNTVVWTLRGLRCKGSVTLVSPGWQSRLFSQAFAGKMQFVWKAFAKTAKAELNLQLITVKENLACVQQSRIGPWARTNDPVRTRKRRRADEEGKCPCDSAIVAKAEADSPFDPAASPHLTVQWWEEGTKYFNTRAGKDCSLCCVCVNRERGTMPPSITGVSFLPVCILHQAAASWCAMITSCLFSQNRCFFEGEGGRNVK